MSDDDTDMNTKGLDDLLRVLKNSKASARIGILGSAASQAHGDTGATNGEVGAWHEYGTTKMPQRSFLRMPITMKLNNVMKESNALAPDVIEKVIREKSLNSWLKKICILAEEIVFDAFLTRGYGKWAPWSPGYKSKTGQMLVNTGQLSRSITSEVTEG